MGCGMEFGETINDLRPVTVTAGPLEFPMAPLVGSIGIKNPRRDVLMTPLSRFDMGELERLFNSLVSVGMSDVGGNLGLRSTSSLANFRISRSNPDSLFRCSSENLESFLNLYLL